VSDKSCKKRREGINSCPSLHIALKSLNALPEDYTGLNFLREEILLS